MKFLDLAHSCLFDVLYKEIPFKLAVDKACKKKITLPEERSKLTGIVGCSLRHFYIFQNIIERLDSQFNQDQIVGLFIYMSNQLFINAVEDKKVREYLSSLNIKEDVLTKLAPHIEDKAKLIPSEYASDSIEYLHFRYNIPIWILKMWMKHFKGYTYKIVKSLNKNANHYAIINKRELDEDKLLSHQEFEKTSFNGLYKYNGKVAQNHYSLYKEGKIASITPAEFYLLNKLDLDPLRKIGFYVEKHNNLHIQLMAMLSNHYKMDVIAGEDEAYYPVKKDVENYSLVNVDVYQAKHSSIITCLSEKVNNFFVLPANTGFDGFRKAPDYFNRIKQDSLDSLLANQQSAIEDASNFVEDGGNLIYMVPTMDKKETVQIIENFLNKHDDFVLVEQKQFLPFDKYDSVFYYAVLRKEIND